MKIAFTGFPLARLMGGDPQKKAQARVQVGAALGPTDTGASSTIGDRAAMKYLQAVDDITSDLLHIVDDYPPAVTGGDIPVTPDQLPGGKAVNIPDMFIYYPSSASGGESSGPGQIIVVQGGLPSPGAGFPEVQDEQAVSDLVKTIVRQLSAVDKGIGLKSADIGSVAVRDRFVIFMETKEGVPVLSVVRQEPSGRSELLGRDQVRDEGISDIITKLNAVIATGGPVETRQPEAFSAGGEDAKVEAAAVPASIGMPEGSEAGSLFDLVKAARAIVSSVFSGGKQEEGTVENAEDRETPTLDEAARTVLPDGATSDTIPGMVIRYVGASSPPSGIPGRADPGVRIIDKLMSLEKLLEDALEFDAPIDGLPEDGAMALEAVRASIKEKIPVMVRDALQAAGRNAQPAYSDNNAGPFGVHFDEKGFLRIDSATLAESLSEKKEETVQFIRDFGGSLQDRLRYDFNPLAGVYAGGQDTTGITEPGKKDRAGDDNDEQKARFEERLNKVQLLLRSSYELKDLFVEALSLKNAGPGNETDR